MTTYRQFLAAILIVTICVVPIVAFAAGSNKVNDIKKAERYLVKFEKHVDRAGGKPFSLNYDDKQALDRITVLLKEYPNDPEVLALKKRAGAALMASKGGYIAITEEMLAYRKNEEILKKKVSEIAKAQWNDYVRELSSTNKVIEKAFPCPPPLKSNPDDVIGSYVILEDVRYPDNEFTDTGGQFCFVGSGVQGYYYLQLNNRRWLGAYEALKRYKRQVSQDAPPPWKVLGEISGVAMLLPQAGEEKTKAPVFGWVVQPNAIYVDGKVMALADPELKTGGIFSSEPELAAIKQGMYTFTEVPKDVDPLKLVEIFATAAKEKNWELFLDCIDPARKKTLKAISRLRYFYDNNLERYTRWYVYVQPVEAKPVEVIQGVVIKENSYEDTFLDKGQKETIEDRIQEIVEECRVTVKTYDENGKQTAMPKDVTLRRYNGGRWYINAGYPL